LSAATLAGSSRQLEEIMRSIIRVAATALALLAFTGCGAADQSRDSAAPSSAETARPSGASSEAAVPDPYHIGAADWAVDLEGAREFYAEMPATFQGGPVRHPGGEDGSSPGVTYGPVNTGVSAYSMETDEEIPDAKAVLAAMFGLGMVCDKATYRGTAEPIRGGLIPGFGSGEDIDPWWFACQVDGAEGAPNFRAYAVGWTSGDLGWLTVTPDERTSRELLAVMVDHARR
jgi:hypothetical protein